jgi:type I restriction enzyme S subunit
MNTKINTLAQAKLGEVCNVLSGFGFPEHLQGKKSGDLPFFKVGDISEAWKRGETFLTRANNYISVEDARSIKAKPLPRNTTVFAKIGAAIALNRRAILSESSLVDNNVMGLHPCSEDLDFKYLFHFICTLKLDEYSRATTVPSIRKSDIEQIVIPLPSLKEQQCIVEKIEKQFTRLDAGMAALQRAQVNLKRYRAAVLKAACEGKLVPTEAELAHAEGRRFESGEELLQRILAERRAKWNRRGKYKEPVAPDVSGLPELPAGWTWATVEQVSSIIVDCPHSTPTFVEEGYACIDTTCIKPGRVIREKLRYVSEATFSQRISRLNPQTNDIVFAREGTVGTAVRVPEDLPSCLGQRVMLMRSDDCITPAYFEHCMNSDVVRRQYQPKIIGSTAPHLNVADAKRLCISLPPAAEQQRIVAEVERRLSIIDEMEAAMLANLQRGRRLRQSILQKAFSGGI